MTSMRALDFGPSLVDDKGKVISPEVTEARNAGYEQGLADAKQSLEAKIDQTLIGVRQNLEQLIADQARAFEFLDWTVLEISKQVTEKMIPYQLEGKATEDVEAFVREFLKNFSKKTKLIIVAHSGLKEGLQKIIDERRLGDVDVTIEANDDLTEGDCQLQWDDGGIDRIRGSIKSEIDRIFQCVLDNVPIGEVEPEPEPEPTEDEPEETEEQGDPE